jgi:hypothetical protein
VQIALIRLFVKKLVAFSIGDGTSEEVFLKLDAADVIGISMF